MIRRLAGWSFLLAILFTRVSSSVAGDTIASGESVRDGGSLVSADGSFRLGFFSPGESKLRYLGIWYNTISSPTVVWVANRGSPLPDSTGVLSISGNGSLVLSDAKGVVYWATGSAGVRNPVARLQTDSNFVVIGYGGVPGSYAWQSFDYPTDTLLPGMKLGWDLRKGRNRNLAAWSSVDDPVPGEYTLGMDVGDSPHLFLVRGAARLWRSGPGDGQRFSGIPEMGHTYMFSFNFYRGLDEVYYQLNTLKSYVPSRLVAQPSGVLSYMLWSESSQLWMVFWLAPKDQCDTSSPCGPFGVCNINNSPMCSCLRGFDPRDGRGGCRRRAPLDCRNGADGFVTVARAKLPDTSTAVANPSMGLDECRAACLRNCSCTAYSNAVVTPSSSGCILWGADLTDLRQYTNGGQDLFVRVAAANAGSSPVDKRRGSAVTVVAPVLATLLLGCVGCCIWRRRRRRRRKRTAVLRTTTSETNHKNEKSGSSIRNDLELPLYDFRTIAAATGDFSAENKLGQGGFGPVYMGRLGEEGQEVAVKRLSRNSVQGLDEFKNEIMLIAKLQHWNLVRLLGCCVQGDERVLVYEYMPNKSLDTFLFDKTNGNLLDWKTRYQIINGIARGLLYLHQDSRFRIIHRDLKASNILLDKEMNPKISDFGMARIFGRDETEANTRRVVGTYGYMSPEYIMDGTFSVKSDVFSFGVVVLEIVSGKRNRGMYLSDPNLNLLGYAWSLWKAGKWLELVDSSMAQSFPVPEVLKCINVALLCVQERPEDRPTMASVVQMLGISDIAALPQPKQPGFMATRGPFEVISSSSKGKLGSVNDVTLSTFEAR